MDCCGWLTVYIGGEKAQGDPGCIATGGKGPSCLQEAKDLFPHPCFTQPEWGRLYMKGASRSSSALEAASSSTHLQKPSHLQEPFTGFSPHMQAGV